MLQKNLANLLHPAVVIFLLWLIALIIINPIGEFPLNDDWAYSLVVKEWLDTGVYHVSDWPAMSLFAQICWGTLFAKVFGFSFTALRFSTLVIGAVGVLAFGKILKELHITAPYRALAMGVLLFNPLFLHLSCTFMTDVPFLSTCVIATYFYLKFIQHEGVYWWLLALFFSCSAMLIRQLGLFVPLAFTLALLFNFKSVKTSTLLLSVLGVLLTYASLKGYTYYLDQTTGIPSAFSQVGSIMDRLKPAYVYDSSIKFGGIYLMYIGIFLLPILLTRFWTKSKLFYCVYGVILLGVAFLVYQSWNRLPLGNTIYDLGIGVVTLPDVLKGLSSFSGLVPWLSIVLKTLVVLGILLLSGHLAKGFKFLFIAAKHKLSKEQIFKLGALFFVLGYAFFLIIDYYRFDRYMLPILPFLMMLILPKHPTKKRLLLILSSTLLLIISACSIIGTHDYLAWNKARWLALEYLENQGITSSKIDGGFEYNGWHQTYHRNPDNQYSKSWWFVDEDDYSVAFKPYHNYHSVAAFPYTRWLNWSKDTIHALQRPNWQKIDTFFYDMEPVNTITKTGGSSSFRARSELVSEKLEDSHGKIIFRDTSNNTYQQFFLNDLPNKDITAFSGSHILNMKEKDAYALTHKLYPIKPYEQLSISMYIKGDKKSFGIVTSAPNEKDFHYFHTPFEVKSEANGWKLITAEMKIPAEFPSDTLQLYLWKQKQKPLQIDDFMIIWRRY